MPIPQLVALWLLDDEGRVPISEEAALEILARRREQEKSCPPTPAD